MTERLRIAVAQLNPIVGDLGGNAAKALDAAKRGAASNADLVVLPEMFLTGYQIQDLVDKPAFARDCFAHIERLAKDVPQDLTVCIGGPLIEDDLIYNAYFALEGGAVRAIFRKHKLPNHNVFDEKRLYEPGPVNGPIGIGAARVAFPICEDIWHSDVAEGMEESGAEIFIVPNGSPYARDKHDVRLNVTVSRVVETGLPLIYLNMVGGQDDQIFDGGSFALNADRSLAWQAPFFEDDFMILDWTRQNDGWVCAPAPMAPVPDAWELDYRAMVTSVRDYAGKNGFKSAVLGLSGGVDSALTAVIAADALGPENVHCVMLPSKFTSSESLEDAEAVATLLGAPLRTLEIKGAVDAVGEGLAPFFEGLPPDLTEENVQSRLRGVYLMALSNKFGHMLLTTGNKSEVAVGYATLYGDMSGGYNPLKDLYKTRVFETCRWRNANHRDWMKGPEGQVIPPRVIDKPPTAELREDQKDEDSLPPYPVLDAILDMLIEQDASVAEIVEAGYERETVKHVERLLYLSEYKRFQSAPGARLSTRAFWLDRRYPMTNKWRDPS